MKDLELVQLLREFIQLDILRKKWQQSIVMKGGNYFYLLKAPQCFCCLIVHFTSTVINKLLQLRQV